MGRRHGGRNATGLAVRVGGCEVLCSALRYKEKCQARERDFICSQGYWNCYSIRPKSNGLLIMANILGKAGRFTKDAAAHHRSTRGGIGLIVMATLGFLEGITLAHLWAKLHPPVWLNTVIWCGGVLGAAVLYKWAWRKMDALEVIGANWERGAEGESTVARLLAKLPHEYYVINDLSTPSGNLDHVVVGPTGVFVLDTKNWRGLVTADGNNELMLNGKPTRKREVGSFVSQVMSVRDKVKVLAPGRDHYFKAVFVFTAASVDAKWGTTGKVHCVTDRQLLEYIVEKSFGTRLDPGEAKRVARALRGLADMGRDFAEKANEGVGVQPVLANAA